jgi:PAS domain S-box-containing protein
MAARLHFPPRHPVISGSPAPIRSVNIRSRLKATAPRSSHLSRVIVAVLAFAAATVGTLTLWDAVFQKVPFALYFAAVAFAAWRAGWLAGIGVGLAGVLAISAHQGFPAHLLAPSLVLLGVSVVISLLSAARERALGALRASEWHYRLMVENVRDYAMFMVDLEGRIVRWNVGAERVLGWQEHEIIGQRCAVIFTPEDREKGESEKEIEQAKRQGHAADERWHQRKDGSRFFGTGMMMAVKDGTGRLVGFTKVLRDETERRRAEEQLRRSHDTFYHLIQNNPFGVYVVDADFRLRQVSLGSQKVFSKVRPLLGRDFAEVLRVVWTEPFATEAIGRFRHTLATGEPYSSPSTVQRRQDSEAVEAYDWRTERVTLPDGRFGVVCYFYDLSERQRWEAALREGEERFRLAVMIAQMGTFEIDLRTDAVTVNEPGRDIYGWAPGEPLTFAKVQTHFHPDDRETVMRRVADALRPDGPGEFEVEQRVIRTDGATRWIRVRGRAIFEADGGERRAVRCVGTYLDITGQKDAEEQRERLLGAERAARAEAERASHVKDEFLATLSHELRTPLNAILGWSQILKSGGRDEGDLDEGLRTIERNARAQTQIIEDLLDMSRIISGKVRLDVQRVDLAAVVRGAIETARPAADAKGIRLQSVLDPQAGPVSGDPNRLQQVFWNLLSNAIKFTARGGRVQVLLGRVNSHLEVTVSDTGEGIGPEFLPHVFDRFRQADATTTRRHGGLGLGLSIVKQLVELHGGTVRVTSGGAGQGTTFTVALPLTVIHPDSEPESERRHPDARPQDGTRTDFCRRLAGLTVLVVDDEDDARALIKRLLEQCDATVRTAGSVAEAVELLQALRPDVLVSDIGMPGEDGYSLIKRVRALGPDNGGKVPALALTAYARSEDRMRAVSAGYQMHVAKPVEPAELIMMVASLAGRTG